MHVCACVHDDFVLVYACACVLNDFVPYNTRMCFVYVYVFMHMNTCVSLRVVKIICACS